MGNYDFSLDLESQNTMFVINNWIQPNSQVLEFGSANGRLTKYLSEEKKCDVTIVEFDMESGKDAQKYACESYLGEEIGNIENFYWTRTEKKYQYIIFADVLEHLRIPKEVLKRCKEFLDENGRILVSIPNIAHNSVIIELLKDNFEYQPTGLLDETHVHFFTRKSFEKMVEECGLYVCQTVPIYSRVANNEISNSYLDIPVEVAQFLRKRIEGSVYQYVYNLSMFQENIDKEKNVIEGLEIEKYEELETLFFYKSNIHDHYSDEHSVGKIFRENQDVKFELDLQQLGNSSCVQWHPIIYNGIILLKSCELIANGKQHNLKIKNSNISTKVGNLLIFEQDFPWIEFEKIPAKAMTGKICIDFTVLAYRKSKEFYTKVGRILSDFSEDTEGSGINRNIEQITHRNSLEIFFSKLKSHVHRNGEDLWI